MQLGYVGPGILEPELVQARCLIPCQSSGSRVISLFCNLSVIDWTSACRIFDIPFDFFEWRRILRENCHLVTVEVTLSLEARLAKILASASSIWPRPGLGLVNLASNNVQCKIILVVSISWLYHCNIHYKDVVKHSNVGQKFTYVLLALSPGVLIEKYLPVAGLGLGVSLEVLASTSASWPRLTSLLISYV